MREFYAETKTPFNADKMASAFDGILKDENIGRVWIIQRAGLTVGYAVLTVGFSMEYGGRDAFIDDLFIKKEHRGSGLGRTMMETILIECRNRDVRAIHLEVGRNNIVAKELYRRFGFRDNDRQLLTLRLESNQ